MASWSGLRVLVTGATGGIGRILVERLAAGGASVVVHGRSREKMDALAASTGGEPLVADLASLEEVAGLARRALDGGPIDVLVNNAGVGFGGDRSRRETSRDGFELRLAVNYLAPFVLTEALLALRPPRAIVDVASAGQSPLDPGDLQLERGYDGVTAYRRSKLAMVMHTFDVAEAYPGVRADALHPGTFLDTGMVREAGIAPLGTAASGAEAVLHVLAEALEKGTTGVFFREKEPSRALEQAHDPAARRALRDRTLQLVGRAQPESAGQGAQRPSSKRE